MLVLMLITQFDKGERIQDISAGESSVVEEIWDPAVADSPTAAPADVDPAIATTPSIPSQRRLDANRAARPTGLSEQMEDITETAAFAWKQKLLAATSVEDLSIRMRALADYLSGLPPETASELISEYLDSQRDIATGLPFRVGRDSALSSSPTLRVFLIDLWGRIDPDAAANYARTALENIRHPDEHALHLRNFARGGSQAPEDRDFLTDRTLALILANEWRKAPTAGFAESFDLVVYLNLFELAPRLAADTAPGMAGNIRHASYLALDRLVLNQPTEVLPMLLDNPDLMAQQTFTRAGFFARADMADPQQLRLVEAYLLSTEIPLEEKNYFFELFPNLNVNFSHNLLTEVKMPDSYKIEQFYRNALVRTERWLDTPAFADRIEQLEAARSRLRETLGY